MNELKNYMLANKDALVADTETHSLLGIDKEALIILARLVTTTRVKYNVAFSKEAINQLITSCPEAKEMREFARQTEELLYDNFNIKMNLVEELSKCLKKMGKKIKVSYF